MRMFHWLFAASFTGAYLTADGEHWRALHVTLGYTLAGLLVFRLLYGLFGPAHARLSLLLRRLAGAPGWLRSVAQGVSQRPPSGGNGIPWRQGQNLLMGAAMLALLCATVPLTLSGYGTYNDWGDFLGGDWLEEVHEFFGNVFLALVLGHIALIAGLSLLRRKNQALPMLTGRVEGAGPDLVKRNPRGLAALLLVSVLAFLGWQWRDSPQGLLPTAASAPDVSVRSHDDD